MRTFTDTKGRVWTLDINVFSIEAVKARTSVDLSCVMEKDFAIITQLMGDMFLRTRVLFVLVEEQCKSLNVSPEGFAQGFSGKVLKDSSTALVEAIADFFEDPTRGMILRVLNLTMEALEKVTTEDGKAYHQALDKVTPSGLAAKLREKFGAMPASSASTPDHSS